MAFYKEQNTRIRLKRTATSGATPSVGPSPDHTDGSWGINDIYGGEFFWNMYDQALWLGWNTGTTSGVTLIYSGGTGGGGTYTADNGLTENPTNNFQLGGSLLSSTQIDGASNTHSLEFLDLLTFKASAQDSARIDSYVGTTGGRFQIDAASISTDWTFTDGGGNTTAFIMDGAKMYIQPPLYTLGTTGDYLRLKDPTTGECDYYPIPGTTSTGCITDFYVTNIHGCSPINMLDDVICQSGLTATTISATTYENLPVSGITAGSNIVISNTNGNVTISQNNAGSNVIWKDNTIFSSNVAANTLVTSKLIPANTFQIDDFFEINANFSGNTPNGVSINVRLYLNTSASLVGATQIALYTNSVGTNQYTGFYRHGFIMTTGTTGTLNILNSTISAVSDIIQSNTSTSIITFDTTIDQYLIFSIQVANTIYTHQIRGINARIQR